jgi:hypothetical protein
VIGEEENFEDDTLLQNGGQNTRPFGKAPSVARSQLYDHCTNTSNTEVLID